MADFTIDAGQLRRLEKSLSKAGVDFKKGTKKLLKKIGSTIGGDLGKAGLASDYAPRSPNKREYEATLKGGKTKRATSSFTSGQLESSIIVEYKPDSVSIGIPSNKPAAKYAEKIHDKRGQSWQNLGPASKKKGPKTGDKFIYRAYDDTRKEQDAFINQTIAELTRDIGV